MKARFFPLLLAATVASSRAGNEIGFVEKFALAADRQAILGQLVPGSEDSYYYQALHLQSLGKVDALQAILDQWARRYPQSDRREVIENRRALLAYPQSAQTTLEFLRKRLDPHLAHEQALRDRKPDLPERLDASRIAPEVFQAQALANDELAGIDETGLEELVRAKVALRPAQVRALLAKIQRPDIPGLLELIDAALRDRESRGFGEFPIHKNLLPAQLDELARRVPALFESQPFVIARLRKLLPGADADAEYDPAEREAWLERTWAYATKLPPAFNTLKAQVLFLRLQHDRTRGVYDRARFLEYLKLPRRTASANPRYLEQAERARFAVDLNTNSAPEIPQIPAIGNDEWLVRDYLLRLLRDDASWESWTTWLRDTYVKPLFAEAKITAGLGDPEQWASLLTPGAFQALKDRVDVDFAPTNPRFFAPADPVSLDVLVKNTPKLIVKVYELNALSYFLTEKRQLNTDINLDGLVPNREITHDFTADAAARSPFRRVARALEFPELKGQRGAWIVEFIGGGRSSRALVRKGQWQVLQQTGPAGDLLTIIDEAAQPVRDAVVWLDGRRLAPDAKTGFIVVPFTKTPGPKPVILADAAGAFATLAQFEHHAETYRLNAQIHIEREQLLARREATVAIHPTLFLGDAQVALALLQDVRLTITTNTMDGIATTAEIPGVTFDHASVYTHRFPVPPRTISVNVGIAAQVESLSGGGEKVSLAANDRFDLNGIARTPQIYDAHLTRLPAGYAVDVLGRNGEAVPDQVVSLVLRHRHFVEPVQASLGTDARGRLDLGPLTGIAELDVTLPNGIVRRWPIQESGATRSNARHVRAGETLRLPWIAAATKLTPRDVSLLERRAGTFVADRFDALSLAEGFLVVKGLPPGDYSLFIPGENSETTIRVTAGTPVGVWLVSPTRQLELRNPAPVQIESVQAGADAVIIQLRNGNPFTRVHVAATRFVPSERQLAQLGQGPQFTAALVEPARRPNLFTAGRAIGDEYRYILERRYTKTYPGNLLPRPGLLLNPWEVRSTDLAATETASADALSRSVGDREVRRQSAAGFADTGSGRVGGSLHPAPPATADWDFLATAAPVLFNLKPDEKGLVRIDRKALGDRHYLQILAEDAATSAWRNLALAEVPAARQDLRLSRPLDAAKAFAERKTVTPLPAGQSLTLADLLTSDLETYDTLGGAFALLRTLHPDESLAKFSFLADWPKLKPEEQRAKYSEFACHELNFFLSRKDPAFFTAVVQPYLRNKKHRTFMDDYLIAADLRRYLEPWVFGQLNVVERCLLAQRLPGESAATARHLRELWELLPPQPDEEARLFETALRGRALSEDADGLRAERETIVKESAQPIAALAAAAPAADTAAKSKSGAKNLLDAAEAPHMPAPAPKFRMAGGADEANLPAAPALLAFDAAETQRLRSEVRAYFRELGPTKEWAENNYYRLPIEEQVADLVTVNAFWRDFAAWDGKAPFLSEHLAEAHRSFTEILLALAVTDLPFVAAKHTTKTVGTTYTLTAGSPLLAYHQQIQPATATPPDEAGAGAGLLVSENFFRADDRYVEDGNEQSDKYVTAEFLPGVLYGANVVVTNPRSTAQKLDLLVQIPEGSLPAQGSKATESRRFRLEPFTTQTLEYFFYFPAAAEKAFAHYPVHVSRKGIAAGGGQSLTFRVVKKLTTEDTTSWDYVSQYATDAEVFSFLEKRNLARLDLEAIAWRARKSAAFFRKLTAFLAQHHIWSEPIYRYALLHDDAPALREWLRHQDEFVAACGPWLDSPLLRIDPVERRAFEHLEYSPLVNQRAHRIGAEHQIANPIFLEQYRQLLDILAHKPALDAADQLSVVYYLFLQDRIEEALTRLRALQPESLTTRLQYDYLRCSAAFYEAQTAEARTIAAGYAEYPVDRWRKLFAEVLAQLDEIEGRQPARPAEKAPPQSELAASEPTFDFKVENRTLSLAWKNLREVTVNYYLMDPEFLFSASPFVTQDASRFSIIKPTRTDKQTLPADRTALDLPLPDVFAKSNVLVEVLGAGQRKAQPYHANTLKLALAENYGRLDLRDSTADRPVTKAYVKVYARLKNGQVRFFKDGYTDLRGRFDYASLNSSLTPEPPRPLPARANNAGGATGLDYPMLAPSELRSVERLSLLILSDPHGATVREVSPPSQ